MLHLATCTSWLKNTCRSGRSKAAMDIYHTLFSCFCSIFQHNFRIRFFLLFTLIIFKFIGLQQWQRKASLPCFLPDLCLAHSLLQSSRSVTAVAGKCCDVWAVRLSTSLAQFSPSSRPSFPVSRFCPKTREVRG
jgi:hypothetical protein